MDTTLFLLLVVGIYAYIKKRKQKKLKILEPIKDKELKCSDLIQDQKDENINIFSRYDS